MIVAELIAELSKLDPSATVVQSRDAEGNGYSPTYTTASGFYRPYNAYSGEFCQPLDDEDRASGQYDPEDEYEAQADDVPCVCLWPTN